MSSKIEELKDDFIGMVDKAWHALEGSADVEAARELVAKFTADAKAKAEDIAEHLFYHVVGWVGFHLTDHTVQGSGGTISGYFTNVIWEGLQGQTGNNGNGNNNGSAADFGASSVQLVN